MTNLWVLFLGLIPALVIVDAAINEKDLAKILKFVKQQTPQNDRAENEDKSNKDVLTKVLEFHDTELQQKGSHSQKEVDDANNLQNIETIHNNKPKTTEDRTPEMYKDEQDEDNSEEDSQTLDNNRLQDYSKIYLVLNPEAIQNSPNKKSLNNLISRLVDLSPRSKKPLVVNSFLLNRRREQELERPYSREDRGNDDYHRKHHEDRDERYGYNGGSGGHGGGGLGGARTSIPYIRQRGNVYDS